MFQMQVVKKKTSKMAHISLFFVIIILDVLAMRLGASPLVFTAPCSVLLYLLLPGFAFYKMLARAIALPKTLCMPLTILCGSGVFTFFTCVAARFGAWWLLQIAPPLLGLLCLAFLWRAGDTMTLPKQHTRNQFLLALLLCLYACCWMMFTAHPAAVGNTVLKQDFLWNVGNARSFALGFPPIDLRFSGVRLQYHYLNELLVGGLAMVSGISAYDWLAFCWPPFVLAAALVVLHALGMVLFADVKQARLLPFAIFAGCGLGAFFTQTPFFNNMLYHLLTNLNAVGTGLVYTGIFLCLAATMLQSDFHVNLLFTVLLCGAAVMLCVAKGPIGTVLVLSFFCAALWRMYKKGGWRTLLVAMILLLLVAVLYCTVFSAGANNMILSADATLLKGSFAPALIAIGRKSNLLYAMSLPLFAAVQTFCENPAIVFLYGICAVRDIRHIKTISAQRVLLHAATLGSLLAFYIFDHYALSQIYFLFLSLQCMTFLAVELWFDLRCKWVKHAVMLLCAISVLAALATAGGMVADGSVRMLQHSAGAEKMPEFTMSAADEHAANWLNQNMSQTQRFATNRYYDKSPEEGNTNLYTALSGRSAYMEGFRYTISNMGVAQSVVETHQIANAILFSPKSTPLEVCAKAREIGVHYLLYDVNYAFTGDTLAQFSGLEQVFGEGNVKIYRVPD